jgi:hypothetical protein
METRKVNESSNNGHSRIEQLSQLVAVLEAARHSRHTCCSAFVVAHAKEIGRQWKRRQVPNWRKRPGSRGGKEQRN